MASTSFETWLEALCEMKRWVVPELCPVCNKAAAAAYGHHLKAHRKQDVFDTDRSGVLLVEVKQKGKRGTMWAMQIEPTSFLGRHKEQMHWIEWEDGNGHQEEPAWKTQQINEEIKAFHFAPLAQPLPEAEKAAPSGPARVSWRVLSWPDFLDYRRNLTSMLRQCSQWMHSSSGMQQMNTWQCVSYIL